MEPNNIYQDLNKDSKKGIFVLLSRNKLFFVAIVVVLLVFGVVIFFSTKTSKTGQQGQSSNSAVSTTSPTTNEKYLGVIGSYNRKTKQFILNYANIKDGKLYKNPKSKSVGYVVSDLNSPTQIKVGIIYNGTKNEGYYINASTSTEPVNFNLNFPATSNFILYVEDARGNLLKQKTVKVN